MAERTPITAIYYLTDPRDGEVRYVGKTSGPLKRRLAQHVNDAVRGRVSIRRFSWIRSLAVLGLKPVMGELSSGEADWQSWERFWIASARYLGFDLCNGTSGGDGIDGHRHSPETLAKMAASARARFQDPLERKKCGDAVREAFRSPESRQKLSQARRIVYADPVKRERIAAAVRLAAQNPERRAKISLSMKGRVISEEARKKISAARKGHKISDAHRAKLAAFHTGAKRSDETKAKIRAAALARYQRPMAEAARG